MNLSVQPPNFSSASLYVGDLTPDVTEALLFEIFNAVGPVASIRVCRDAVTRRSLGYAYVNFHNVVDAERALDTMNFTSINSRPCRIMWSQRDPTLRKSGVGNIFVKNLAHSIDHKTLYDTFSMFGNILSCKVAMKREGDSLTSLGYGFVHYETEEAAQKAIENVDGKNILNQKVRVEKFIPKEARGGDQRKNFTNVYVNNLPTDFDEDKFAELVAKFGKVTVTEKGKGLCLKTHAKSGRKFGFVNFEEHEAAQAAVEGLNEAVMKGGDEDSTEFKVFAARAQKKSEREKELASQFEARRAEQQQKFQGVNLFIKNLADDINDERLAAEFSKFGKIQSHKVMRDPKTDRSRGFGFVCFTTKDEATNAVHGMNQQILAGKPLYVAVAQRKDVRRRELEAQRRLATLGAGAMPGMYPPQGMYFPTAGGPQGVRPMFPGQMVRGPGGPFPPQMMRPGQPGMPFPQQGFPQGPFQGQMPGQGAMQPLGQHSPAGRGRGRGGRQQNRGPAQGQAPAQQQQQPRREPEPLTAAKLVSVPPAQQKRMIGEQLFPKIRSTKPELAGKITGMLLEMDNGELLHLLDSQPALDAKIDEALQVLQAHENTADRAQTTAADSTAPVVEAAAAAESTTPGQ
jgi:polyadenylate-binding protein